jgi:hypothetical protein
MVTKVYNYWAKPKEVQDVTVPVVLSVSTP